MTIKQRLDRAEKSILALTETMLIMATTVTALGETLTSVVQALGDKKPPEDPGKVRVTLN